MRGSLHFAVSVSRHGDFHPYRRIKYGAGSNFESPLAGARRWIPAFAGMTVGGVGFIHDLTNENDGLVAAMTLLLFPSTAILYGGVKVIFAAKEAVEEKAREKERRRILNVLEQRGIKLDPDTKRDIGGSDGARS